VPVPLLDISRQYARIKSELDQAVINVLEHGRFILGPEVAELESQVAELCTTKYAVGVASGTDALLLALRAIGVGPGDEVITSDFSFFASASTTHLLGAKPVFVDIEPDTYNIDPNLIEEKITPKTKAIIPVHLFGQIADMDSINQIAAKHNLIVIEDAAQAIGAKYKGRAAGSMSAIGCFSFYPTKNLGAAGDAGIVSVSDNALYERLKRIRVHGASPKYYHREIGYNSRLDTIQAAVLLVKFKYLDEWTKARQRHARVYDQAFADVDQIVTPTVRDYSTSHIYNQYTIAVPNREKVMAGLKEAEIGCEIYYPVAFHAQDCFAYLGGRDDNFPVTTRAASEVLAIPIYPELTESEQSEVIETLIKLVK
jgi:dTDP-4-amino-4,6-dideoxygalactose transaminase